MSGEQRASRTIYEDEFNRLMDATRLVENSQANERQLAEQARLARQQLDRAIEEGRQRQNAFDQTVDSLSEELQSSTREFSSKLHRQQQQFEQGFDELDQRMQAQRAELKSDISGITARLDRKDINAKNHAQHWLADAEMILDHIDQNYRHEKFMPGHLEQLKGKQQLAQSNMHNGVYEAAISTGQEVFSDALALKAELEMLEQEWNGYFSKANEGARKLLAACSAEQSRKFSIESTDGEKELDAEIDYWTDGALSRLISVIKIQLSSLEGEREQLNLTQIKQAIETNDAWQKQHSEIVIRARKALVASQLRFEMAEGVVHALEDAGWEVKDTAWEGEGHDGRGWKGSFHIKLKNFSDDEMVTVIMPKEDHGGNVENELQFAYYSANYDDSTFAEIQTSHIQQILREKELINDAPMQCVPGQERVHRGRPERQDFDKVRQYQQVASD